ncbi:MAG: ABC transporter permease [Desulfomonilaceae bacterium]
MTVSTLLKFNIRYYRRHTMLSLLCIMGIALGVGIVVAVELINNSALASFSSYVDLLSGRATHSIISAHSHIDENLFARIWTHPQIKSASPVVEVVANVVEASEPLRFIGIDPFLDSAIRNWAPNDRDEAYLINFLSAKPPAVLLTRKFMNAHELKPGAILTVLTAGIEKKIQILGILPSSIGEEDNLALIDIAAAQEVFGRAGRLDRIEIIMQGDSELFRKDLPVDLKLTDASSRKSTLQAMLYSFQLNLAAMSLLALFVGIFLIYNFSMFSVLSRRQDMSLLLTLGSDRAELVRAFIAESLVLGIVGSLTGIIFGYLMALFSIDKVSSTITDLYFYVNVQSVRLTVPILLTGIGVGFTATLIGIAIPALETAFTSPIIGMKRRSIEDRAHGIKGLLFISGLICFLAALISAWGSKFSIFWGFASAFGMTLAFAFFTPSILSPFTYYLGIFLKWTFHSWEAFLAACMIRASLSRTSIAVAALAVALSMTLGVDTMIHSFRESVSAWLDGSLQGNLYIAPATTKWDHPLPPSLIETLKNDPRIQDVERYSTYEIFLEDKPVRLRVVDAPVLQRHSRFHFISGGEGAWDKLQKGGVFVSESLGYHFGLGIGNNVILSSPDGKLSFPVVAIVRDYSSDQGAIQIDRQIYEGIWKDDRVQSVALFLRADSPEAEIRKSIVKRFPGLDRTIVSNSQMKNDALKIFDKTFAPTSTLKGISLIVALLGIATALMAILMERSREMRVLGYLGLTPRELGKMNIYQASIMGFLSFLISVPCGLILTYIITYAINFRSFGWSIDMFLDPWVLGRNLLLTSIACLAAALYPTYKLMRGQAFAGLEEE